jgi:hypothetical protein
VRHAVRVDVGPAATLGRRGQPEPHGAVRDVPTAHPGDPGRVAPADGPAPGRYGQQRARPAERARTARHAPHARSRRRWAVGAPQPPAGVRPAELGSERVGVARVDAALSRLRRLAGALFRRCHGRRVPWRQRPHAGQPDRAGRRPASVPAGRPGPRAVAGPGAVAGSGVVAGSGAVARPRVVAGSGAVAGSGVVAGSGAVAGPRAVAASGAVAGCRPGPDA